MSKRCKDCEMAQTIFPILVYMPCYWGWLLEVRGSVIPKNCPNYIRKWWKFWRPK